MITPEAHPHPHVVECPISIHLETTMVNRVSMVDTRTMAPKTTTAEVATVEVEDEAITKVETVEIVEAVEAVEAMDVTSGEN